MKTYYELLAVDRSASAEEVKRAFRREIARYHPDKVQHLGPEFQEIAAARAAALTEAYRILMDVELRRSYDESIADGTVPPVTHDPEPSRASASAPPPTPPPSAPVDKEPGPPPGQDRHFQQARATTAEYLRRAVMVKIRAAAQAAGGEPVSAPGFDAAFVLSGKRGLFKKSDPTVRLLFRVVQIVDAEAVAEAWTPALRAAAAGDTPAVLLLGSGLAPAKELSAAISEHRRRSRQRSPIVIPVDMRDWDALLPTDTPVAVRSLLDRLRRGE